MDALAFTRGQQVTFSGSPTLFTAAHEAAHAVQQRRGAGDGGAAGDRYERHADQVAERVVRGQSSEALLDSLVASAGAGDNGPAARASSGLLTPVTQMRRIPPDVKAILTEVGGGDSANLSAHAAGVEELIKRAVAEMTPAEQAQVTTERLGGLTEAAFNALSQVERLTRHAKAVLKVSAGTELGDPRLIDTGPRGGTADATNITKLCAKTDLVFTAIVGGAHNTWLGQVFGPTNIATARAKYAEGQKWMNNLKAANKIVTDRSGYNAEVSLGGLTGFQTQISVAPEVIDKPTDNESVVTLIHEAMHAGNNDVDDKGYIGSPSFTKLSEADKLMNAAHFEIVPRRALGAANSFPNATFIPAGAAVGGVAAPALTPVEQATRQASEAFRAAWTTALNLHSLFVDAYKNPTSWTSPQPSLGNKTYDGALPYWSKVEMLTIHDKVIDPASPELGRQPVSQIDVALSEGVTRKLAQAMNDVPTTEADALAYEAKHESAAELARLFPGGTHDAATVPAERDLLIKLAVQRPPIGPITGAAARDVKVVKTLEALSWGDVLNPKPPSAFP